MLSERINNYYDKQKQQYAMLSDATYTVNIYKHDDKDIVDVYKQNKKIVRGYYDLIGYYNTNTNIFVWAYANPFVEKDMTKKVASLKDKKEMLMKVESITDELRELYLYFISNSSMYISKENLQQLLKFVLYYMNGHWIVERKNADSTVNSGQQLEFLLINEISQIK